MVPSYFVFLDAMPVTANGKIDRRALPAPGARIEDAARIVVPPATPVEEMLVSLWVELLAVDPISVRDNFFELGGHSLIATQLISRVRRDFQTGHPFAGLVRRRRSFGLRPCESSMPNGRVST